MIIGIGTPREVVLIMCVPQFAIMNSGAPIRCPRLHICRLKSASGTDRRTRRSAHSLESAPVVSRSNGLTASDWGSASPPAPRFSSAEFRPPDGLAPAASPDLEVAGQPEDQQHQHDEAENSAAVMRAAPSSTPTVIGSAAAQEQHEQHDQETNRHGSHSSGRRTCRPGGGTWWGRS
jgi:hypothetical protein